MPSAKSLHLYGAALVSRRVASWAPEHFGPRAVRALTAALLRGIFPEAGNWRSLPDDGAVDVLALPPLGAGWGDAGLAGLAALAAGDQPGAGAAAARLSELAEAARLPLAAAALAEAAALAAWDDPTRALRVAMLARGRADHTAAEWWGGRTATLARALGAWPLAVSGYARVAEAAAVRGDHAEAARVRRRELRAAERSGSRQLVAQVHHNLATSYWRAGDLPRARGALAVAVRLYGANNPRLPSAAADSGFLLVESGEAAAALPVLRLAAPLLDQDRERVNVLVTMARACAMVADGDGFDAESAAALAIYEREGWGEGAAWGLATLAEAGARHLGEIHRPRAWAERALVLAEERGEVGPLATARAVLAEL